MPRYAPEVPRWDEEAADGQRHGKGSGGNSQRAGDSADGKAAGEHIDRAEGPGERELVSWCSSTC